MSDNRRPRRTGGAGSLTNPLSDEDYHREMRKLEAKAAAESREEQGQEHEPMNPDDYEEGTWQHKMAVDEAGSYE